MLHTYFHYHPVDFLKEEHAAALSKFEAAVHVLNGTRTLDKKLKKAKKALRKARSVPEFVDATNLFRGTANTNPRIAQGKDLLFAAAKIVRDAEDAIEASSLAVEFCNVGPSAPVADADVARASLAQARLSAPALQSPLDQMHRVVLSATEPVEATPAAGDKRPADKDEDSGKKPCLAQTSNAAEKAAKEEVEYAWDIFDETGDGWHVDVLVAMAKVQNTKKCSGFAALDQDATDQLRTLPVNVAELLLNKLCDEPKKISDGNVSAWIVKNGNHLRNQWSIYDPDTIYEEMEAAYKDRRADHRDEDESVAEHNSDSASDSDDDAGAPCVYKCDSKGNSIEY